MCTVLYDVHTSLKKSSCSGDKTTSCGKKKSYNCDSSMQYFDNNVLFPNFCHVFIATPNFQTMTTSSSHKLPKWPNVSYI